MTLSVTVADSSAQGRGEIQLLEHFDVRLRERLAQPSDSLIYPEG